MRTDESNSANGFARFLPAMSGALPWTASNTAMSLPRLADPTTPRPPTNPAHKSETISPYRFGMTRTSNCRGVEHQLHAGGIDDFLAVLDIRVQAGYCSNAFEKETVTKFHDVRLVYRGHLPTAVAARVVEGEFCNTRRGALGDDLQALDNARNDFVLEARIKIFGVLSNDDEVHAGETRRHTRQVPNRPKVGIQIELFTKRDVDAREPFADRGRHRTLQSDLVPEDRVDDLRRQGMTGALNASLPATCCSQSIETPAAWRTC